MARAAAFAVERFGYRHININVGCPSDAVQSGSFGAILMKDPEKVAAIATNVKKATSLLNGRTEQSNSASFDVSVKCRVGVDEFHCDEFLDRFVDIVSSQGGVRDFIVHARHCWLKGLNPKQNRSVPPLQYERVYRLVEHFPHLRFTLNGGIRTVEECLQHARVAPFDGVMIGRKGK
jgi:tRNA-dihydrouridine synthase A